MLRVAIVGRPNVGKSTLFNRLTGKQLAIVDDTPGVTRDWRESDGRILDQKLRVIDTAGLEEKFDDSMEARMRRQTRHMFAPDTSRAYDRDVCVIATSSVASVELAVATMKYQAFHYLQKPIDADEVLAVVAEAMASLRKMFGEAIPEPDGMLYPRWLSDLYAGSGSPVFFYYPPLAYWLTVFFALLARLAPWDAFFFYPMAAATWVGLVISGLTFYAWMREEGVEARAALAGSLFYLCVPNHLAQNFYYMMLYSSVLAYAWVPLLMVFARRIGRGQRGGLVAPAAEVVAGDRGGEQRATTQEAPAHPQRAVRAVATRHAAALGRDRLPQKAGKRFPAASRLRRSRR